MIKTRARTVAAGLVGLTTITGLLAGCGDRVTANKT